MSSMLLGRFDYLGQYAAGRARVQERDPRVADPRARLGIDQLDPGVAQLGEYVIDVPDGVRDVVQAGPALGEVLADRRIGVERPEQLDVTVADVEQGGL